MLLDRYVGRRWPIFMAIALWLIAVSVQGAERVDAFAALNSIRTVELKQHVDVLASDQYEGREAGSTGGKAAGDYIVQRLQENQISAAGDAGGYYQEFGNGYRNILGWIEGSDPELKSQYILVGAHYDHVGYGNSRNSFGPIGQIHNGADDNASGTSGLVEIMQAFATLPVPPKRSVLFVWWDAEEMGMLGSKHWTANPTIPLEDLVCVFNIDMIGRLRDNRIEAYGARTSHCLRQLVSRENVDPQLAIDFVWETKANSDHYPFFRQNIPFIMLHTGVHDDYHRPRDDAQKINAQGMRHVSRLVFRLALDMADRNERLEFRSASRYESEATRQQLERTASTNPPRLGVSWAADDTEQGLLVSSVAIGSAAQRAGIQPGDRITRFDGREVDDKQLFSMIVLAAPSTTQVVVQRAGEEKPLELEIELTGVPIRVGISWREDAAEPGSVILSRVTTGSAAYLAGLLPTDRIYEVAGHTFDDTAEFREMVTGKDDHLELLVERRGRLSTVRLDLLTPKPETPNQPEVQEPALAP